MKRINQTTQDRLDRVKEQIKEVEAEEEATQQTGESYVLLQELYDEKEKLEKELKRGGTMKRIKSEQKKKGEAFNVWVLHDHEIQEIAERIGKTLSDDQVRRIAEMFKTALYEMVPDWDSLIEQLIEDMTA